MICEGVRDVFVLNQLVYERPNLEGFQFAYPPDIPGRPKGRQGFSSVLESLGALRGAGLENIQMVVFISDNDTAPGDGLGTSFIEVKEQIARYGNFGIPDYIGEIRDPMTPGFPRTSIFMLPTKDKPGQLEDLCLEAAATQRADLQPHLDEYTKQARLLKPGESWSGARIAKMRLRILMSTHYPTPNTDLRSAWQWRPHLISVSHVCFNELAEFLAYVKSRV